MSRRQRHEFVFGANKKVQDMIFPRVVVDKEELQAMPAVIEAELRAEALKAIDDVLKRLLYCVRLVGDHDELAAKAAFGAERGAVQHELYYVRVVDIHLKQSMG